MPGAGPGGTGVIIKDGKVTGGKPLGYLMRCISVAQAAEYVDHLPDTIPITEKGKRLAAHIRATCPKPARITEAMHTARIAALVALALNKASSVPGPVRGVADAWSAFAGFVGALFTGALWMRVLFALGGIVLLWIGLAMLLKQLGVPTSVAGLVKG